MISILAFGDMVRGMMVNYTVVDYSINFKIISVIMLIISISLLVLEIMNGKTRFRVPIVVLAGLMIILSIASLILSILTTW